jgi:PAS domain S-box-containing protein
MPPADTGAATPPQRWPCGREELATARAREASLLRAAEPSLIAVHQALAGHPHVVAVTDRNGLVLRLLRSGEPEDDLHGADHVREGMSWSEQDVGRNGVGTALATGEPVVLSGADHFQESHRSWASLGVPVRDGDGTVVGAMGLALPDAEFNLHTRGWLQAVVHAVDARLAAEDRLRTAGAGLTAREQRLSMVVDALPDSVFIQDMDLRYVWTAGHTAPFRRSDCIGRTDAELLDEPDDARMLTELKRRVLRESRRTTADFAVRMGDGRRYFQATYEPARDGSGAITGLLGCMRDVTDERRMREALRESEARLRTLADSIPQLAWMADATGWIFWFNKRWFEYTGLSLAESEGWGWTRAHHPEHVARVEERIRRSWQTGEPWEDTFPLRDGAGDYRWFLSRALPIRDSEGHVVRWFGTNTDVTDQLALEHARCVSEERLRRIAESGMVGVLYWELGGRVTYANRYFLDMLGYAADNVEDGFLDWRAITPPEWQDVDEAAVAQLTARGTASPFEKEFVASDGRRVPVLLSAATFENDSASGVALVLDMTERRRAARELERLYEEAERAVRQREEVIGFVSHDLRNPLSTIAMASSLLLEPGVSTQKKSVQADVIRRAVDQMARLIQDLLDVSRLGARSFRMHTAPESPGALVEAALQLNAAAAEAAGIRLLAEVQPGLRHVRADRQRVLQVLANLLANAIAHTPTGGSIRLCADPGEGRVVFSVSDTGSGIPADELTFVFDSFWQGRRSSHGAGLGLTICKGIVEAHDGVIGVNSEVGRGTTFSFTLPTV